MLLKPVFYVYAQSLHVHTGLIWEKLPTALDIWQRVGYTLPKLFMECDLTRHEIWLDWASLAQRGSWDSQKAVLNVVAARRAC